MTSYNSLSDSQKAIVDLVSMKEEPMSEATIFTWLVEDKSNFPAVDVKDSLEFLEADGWITEVLCVGRRWSLTLAARNQPS